jgi:Flp pilus assembly protein TadG
MGKESDRMRKTELGGSTFLSRLRRNERGNVVALVAASLIPLLGAIGGGVDMTRAYMAEARLAQACDAAALAGRKVMTDNDADEGSEARDEIEKFVAYNFPEGTFGATEVVMAEPEVSDSGELTLALSSSIPAQLLHLVGVDSISINAECSARRSGVNVDVMLALDVTGSMAWSIAGSADGSNARIIALRAAAKSFLGVLNELHTQLADSGMRVRVGILPYSQAANVGKLLYAEDPTYIDYSSQPYATDLGNPTMETQWNSFRSRWEYRWVNASVSGSYDDETLSLDEFVTKGLAETTPANPYAWKGCVEMRSTVTDIDSGDDPYTTIPNNAWDILDVAPGESYGGGTAPKWRPFFASPWEGANTYGPKTSGSDMTLTSAPWSQVNWDMNTSWRTSTSIVYNDTALSYSSDYNGGKSTRGPNKNCPDEARLLATIDDTEETSLGSYIDALKPNGGTYHDIGMYWALALISPNAPFENETSYLAAGYSGDAPEVKKYIVFMTDGELDPSTSYTAYSRYDWDKRTSTSTSEPTAQHRARFRMVCEAAKKQGIEVATVVFSTSVGDTDRTSLESCATSSDQYYEADTAEDLEEAFTNIAENIGYLRVSK